MNTGSIKHALAIIFNNANIKIPFFVTAADTVWETLDEYRNTHRGQLRFPFVLITNTDPIRRRGQHWTAWFVHSETRAEFFDPYGFSASRYRHIQWPAKNIIAETCSRLQSERSTLCGAYCIHYCFCRALGITYKQFLDLFTDRVLRNDNLIKNFICSIPKFKCYSSYKCPWNKLQSNTYKLDVPSFCKNVYTK